MADTRSKAAVPSQSPTIQAFIDSLALIKKGLLLGILGIALAIAGEAIPSDTRLFLAMHVIFKYSGVALFITCGVMLLVEKLPETTEMRELEREMKLHASAIEGKNEDGRSQVIKEGSDLAGETLQKLFETDVADAVKRLLTIYLSIPPARKAQRQTLAWLLKNEVLTHISNLARFSSAAEGSCFDVRYLGSGPYFTAAVLTAQMMSLEEGDEYFSAGEIWFWLDSEATKDFIAEIKSACNRGVGVRRVFDLNSPSPFNFRPMSEDQLQPRIESVLEQHRQLARDTHGMYEFAVLQKSEGKKFDVERYAVFSKYSKGRQIIFRPLNRELGTFTLDFVSNTDDLVGAEDLWNRAWMSQSTTTRLIASLKRGYAWCRRRFVGMKPRAWSYAAIVFGLLCVYWSQSSLSHHGAMGDNIEQHESAVTAPESLGAQIVQTVFNALPTITRDLKYDIGIALEISGFAAMLIAPQRRRLKRATERASHDFSQFEKRREATAAARAYKAMAPTSREGLFQLFEKATTMCVDDDKCSATFVNLVYELNRLRNRTSPERDALWNTAKWVLTEHVASFFGASNDSGNKQRINEVNAKEDEEADEPGLKTFRPPREVDVMERVFGELLAHARRGDSLDSLIDFEYFIPTDAERFEMEKLREALAAKLTVRRIFHCTYDDYAQPTKNQVSDSDKQKIFEMHEELQRNNNTYHVKYLTTEVINGFQARARNTYGIENLNQYLHAALKLRDPSGNRSASTVYYLNIRDASDEKQLNLQRTDARDPRITFFDRLWEAAETHPATKVKTHPQITQNLDIL
jgi:hypothetical protein